MLITDNNLLTISKTKNIRMGLSYSKECHASFLNRFFDDCKIRLKQLCNIEKGTTITEDDTEEGMIPVVAGGKEYAYRHNESNRKPNVITISASGANSGFVNFWDEEIWASDCITVVSKDEQVLVTKFLYYILKLIQDDIYLLQKGADQPHVYADDIQKIRIPSFPIDLQKEVLCKIEVIEREIDAEQQKEIREVKNIVSECFGKYFNYDYERFSSLVAKKISSCEFAKFGNNVDTRFSTKFHREAGEFVNNELSSRPHMKIKKCLVIPMITGQGISTDDYDDSGEYAYISMADISAWEVDSVNINHVSNDYANNNKAKKPTGYKELVSTEVKKNDILMMRSGEGGIGKVAIFREDFPAIFCDFIIRMRFDERVINPLFAYYYFRSDFFQYLIEINKKGLGNNTNIFPNQVQEFLIPDISLKEQEKIIDEIENKLRQQRIIVQEISEKRLKIDSILNSISW